MPPLARGALNVVPGPPSDLSVDSIDNAYQYLFEGRPLNDAGTAIGIGRPSFVGGTVGFRFNRAGVVSRLGPITSGSPYGEAYAYAINRNGLVVGTVSKVIAGNFQGFRAVRWTVGTSTPTELGFVAGQVVNHDEGRAVDVNDAGTTIGDYNRYDASGNYVARYAMVWPAGQTAGQILGTLGTRPIQVGATPAAINASGLIVGTSDKLDSLGNELGSFPVRWAPGSTTPIEMQTLGNDASNRAAGAALGVNNAGQSFGLVARYDTTVFKGTFAARWSATGVVQALNPLSLDANGIAAYTTATGMNASGAIVGYSSRPVAADETQLFPVLWQPGSDVAVELQTLPHNTSNFQAAAAYGINASGYVCGVANTNASDRDFFDRAVVWKPDHTIVDLNTLLDAGTPWTLTTARAISDTGWVTGSAFFKYAVAEDGSPKYTARLFSLLVPQAGTYGRGDADFNARVDFDDLLILAKHYGRLSNGSTDAADFDLDGDTDFDDLLTLARNYGNVSATLLAALADDRFASDFALAQSLVPEPSAFLLLVGTTCAIRRHR